MRKNLKKMGFTLAEMMVSLAVISVIASILIPTIATIRPNKEKTMFKKAYQITERIVSELINDPDLYYEGANVSGFDNVGVVDVNNTEYGALYENMPEDCVPGEDGTFTGENADKCNTISKNHDNAKKKFCELFALKLNTSITSGGICSTGDNIASPSFTTADGIQWALPHTYFTSNSSESGPTCAKITVDVNGSKGPNTLDTEDGGDSNVACTNHSVDRFNIYVHTDGKIEVIGACARAYLRSSKLITDANDSDKSVSLSCKIADGTVAHVAGTFDSNAIWDEKATGTKTEEASCGGARCVKHGTWDDTPQP